MSYIGIYMNDIEYYMGNFMHMFNGNVVMFSPLKRITESLC